MHVLLLTILFIVFFFLFCHIHSPISNWINILCFNHTNCVQSTDYIRLIWMCWFICILFLSIFLGYAYMHEIPFGFFFRFLFWSEILIGNCAWCNDKIPYEKDRKMRLPSSFIDMMYMLINIQFMHINTNEKDYNIDHKNNDHSTNDSHAKHTIKLKTRSTNSNRCKYSACSRGAVFLLHFTSSFSRVFFLLFFSPVFYLDFMFIITLINRCLRNQSSIPWVIRTKWNNEEN